ncbi:hypothetical protein Tco_1276151 [Tanacetum coccineum]
MNEILHQLMFESGSYRSHPEHVALYEALEASMDRDNRDEFLKAMAKSRKRRHADQDPPQAPPKDSDQKAPSSSSKQKSASQSEQPVEDVPIPDDTDWEVKYQIVRAFHSNSISLQFQMEECHLLLTDQIDVVNPKGNRIVPDMGKPLPLGDQPGQWIKREREYDISAVYGITHWWFKRKEFYINRHNAPSNHRAVRSHMQILNVVSIKTYERYGYTYLREIILRRADYKEYKISEAGFKNLHSNDFENLYLIHLQGKLNHLSGADKVHIFNAVNLWIRNIVIRKCMEDLQLGIESYQTKLNLTQPNWDASDFFFKEDYTIVSKPRVVIYRDKNDQKKMMRESEVHKFSDGTLTRVLEKLEHMVTDFRLFKYNPGMENRIWSEDDKRRSKEFMEVIKSK